jgi:hypothetical protein
MTADSCGISCLTPDCSIRMRLAGRAAPAASLRSLTTLRPRPVPGGSLTPHGMRHTGVRPAADSCQHVPRRASICPRQPHRRTHMPAAPAAMPVRALAPITTRGRLCPYTRARSRRSARLGPCDARRPGQAARIVLCALWIIRAGQSASTVRRWLHQDALKPWQHRSWISITDPGFGPRAARVLDLYSRTWQGRALGEDEYVIGAGVKTSIQPRCRCALSQMT